jgi:hypothetical protein
MPQAAGHSMHVVAYQEAWPGTASSGGAERETSSRVGGGTHPVPAATPVIAASFRKFRRWIVLFNAINPCNQNSSANSAVY